jgi:hypothetical protein
VAAPCRFTACAWDLTIVRLGESSKSECEAFAILKSLAGATFC